MAANGYRLAVLHCLVLFVFSALLNAQSAPDAQAQNDNNRIARIGVPMMTNASTRSINGRLQRDWLVREFQPSKKKKKDSESQHFEAIPLESNTVEDALREARSKNCEYVLFTKVVELRQPGDPQVNSPGTVSIGRDPMAGNPDPSLTHDLVNYAVVRYQLARVGDPEPLIDSSVSGQEHSDENGTVHSLLFQIANRVKDQIR